MFSAMEIPLVSLFQDFLNRKKTYHYFNKLIFCLCESESVSIDYDKELELILNLVAEMDVK